MDCRASTVTLLRSALRDFKNGDAPDTGQAVRK
jgi:hypothetical protein